MEKTNVSLSSAFKKQVTKSIMAIGFFIFVYTVVLLCAVALAVSCAVAGIAIIIAKPATITLLLGLGLISLGLLVLYFLLKFMFASNTTDRSHLLELRPSSSPKLFEMIQSLVEEVGTKPPKKVYLSGEVNAAVFYDSNFWSMFLPIKKNLQIGMALINSVTDEELKAILAHEFGHFSQRSMKVGSYVYNVNRILFDMLYNNHSYENTVQQLSSFHAVFSLFVRIAVFINEGIQRLFKEVYKIVNVSYMALSREMEFHADEIASSITGYEPLKSSLLRLPLADNAFEGVISFYNKNLDKNLKSQNIYDDFKEVLSHLAEINNLPSVNGLPNLNMEEKSKFDKSKLVMKDQWASHPSTKERIEKMEQTGNSKPTTTSKPATDLFEDIEKLQQIITDKIFKNANYNGEVKNLNAKEFFQKYEEDNAANSFSPIYNGFYAFNNPVQIDFEKTSNANSAKNIENLVSDEVVDKVYSLNGLMEDIKTLEAIDKGEIKIKTFDYDGRKYKSSETKALLKTLRKEQQQLQNEVNDCNQEMYDYFINLEQKSGNSPKLKQLMQDFKKFDDEFEEKSKVYINVINDLQFLSRTTSFDKIKSNFKALEPKESIIKSQLNEFLADEKLQSEWNESEKADLEIYANNALTYFKFEMFDEKNLELLYKALDFYLYLLHRKFFLMKKEILDYQESLI